MPSRSGAPKSCVYGLDLLDICSRTSSLIPAGDYRQSQSNHRAQNQLNGKTKGSLTETLDTVNKLGEVLCDWCYHATKSSTRLPESNNHPQIIKVIDLCIRFPLCQSTLLAHLCRIFGWKGWDDLSVTVLSYAVLNSPPHFNVYCDGCKRDLDITTWPICL